MGLTEKLNRFNDAMDASNAAVLKAAQERVDLARAEADSTYIELLDMAASARAAGVPDELIEAELSLVRQHFSN